MDYLNKLLVLYGTETGNAQKLSELIWYDARCRRITSEIFSIDDFDIKLICSVKFIVFVISTCGDGEMPQNMIKNWRKLLIKKLPSNFLSNLNFSVIGLGDSSYEKYNFAAKRLFRRILQLGGKNLLDLELFDDQHPLGIEGAMFAWRSKFWSALSATDLFFNFEINAPLERIFKLKSISNKLKTNNQYNLSDDLLYYVNIAKQNVYSSIIVKNFELHQIKSERSCRHIEFSISNDLGEPLNYKPGDHLAVFPANDLLFVNKIGYLLNIDLDVMFQLVDIENDNSFLFPNPCTYRTALTYFTDITSPIQLHVLEILVNFTKDEMQQEKLKLFSKITEEGIEEYYNFVYRPRRSIIDILEQLNSCKPPIDLLIEILPRLYPRYYSISSSPKLDESNVSITVSVLNYKISYRKLFGVCSNYLAKLLPFSKCLTFIRKSFFSLPEQFETSLIMVGPGTGIAPFRSFLRELLYYKNLGHKIGHIYLFYGCRDPTKDFLYYEELNNYVKLNLITELNTAFSRITPEKIYVQHLLWDKRLVLWNLIDKQNANIYVCGDAKNMAKDVRKMFIKIFQNIGEYNENEANDYLKNLKLKNRYQTDVWS